MNLTRRSLFASAVALLALPRRVAAERLLGPAQPEIRLYDSTVTRVTTYTGTFRLEGSRDGITWRPYAAQEQFYRGATGYRFYIGGRR